MAWKSLFRYCRPYRVFSKQHLSFLDFHSALQLLQMDNLTCIAGKTKLIGPTHIQSAGKIPRR